MPSFEEISSLVKYHTAYKKPITAETRIVEDTGCYGDDLEELLLEYSEKFQVDMSSYLWYFHTREEGYLNFGALIFRTPDKYVGRISITAGMLKEFADKKIWAVNYPEHKIPSQRLDIQLTWIVISLLLLYGCSSELLNPR
jgi:hypothetical protein